MRLFICILALFFLVDMSAQKEYQANYLSAEEISVDGTGSSPLWNSAIELTDFTLPWNDVEPQTTSFKALYSEQFFYFLFSAADHDIVAPGEDGDKLGVLPSDRVEIFFKANGEMNPYYCLEMDPRARVLDYIAHHYRKVDFKWEWPDEDLQVLARQTKEGYSVEGKISISSLQSMDILKEGEMDAGLFRGDYFHSDGDATDVLWITWAIPDNPTPDFHISSAFAKIKLQPR
ncbi:MAG: carbohydrate-binding family 9-like protein [Saprospiraceae bacterium]|nr:carbohydrate-binding family 9-like protein [Saprospiraceae bacterium]